MPQALQSTPDRRAQIAPPAVRRVAERQWGVVSRAQLLAGGVSGTGISRAVKRGWLVRIHPGVYAFTHTSLTVKGRLAAGLLFAGPGAALSHTTAGWWWGMVETRPSVIHVSTTRRVGKRRGLRMHRPRRVEVATHRRLPVTPVPRTLLDLATMLRPEQLRRAVAEADFIGMLDAGAVAAACGPGRPGAAALKRALASHMPELAATRSELERRFLALCERNCLPMPEVNVRVCGHLVDMLWRQQRLVVELDGHRTHARPAAIEADRRRELDLRAAGHRLRRYTWAQTTSDESRVAADLISALAC